jgi:hypothetical protein
MAERRIEKLFDSLSELDRALPVTDISNETCRVLSDRLESSTLPRHFLYREAELDDLWRTGEVTLFRARAAGKDAATVRILEDLLSIAMQAHDLAGEGRVAEATAVLRQLAARSLSIGESG